MNDEFQREEDALEARVTQALETMPYVEVADDFARRVMERLPVKRRRELVMLPKASHVGKNMSIAALMVLGVMMVGLAPWAWDRQHLAATGIEWMFCAEFVVIVLWMSPVRQMLQR